MTRVLVVDDDEDLRLVLRDVLEDEGYEVSEAADGACAIAALRASPHPLVVLLDLVMPPPDGVEFLWTVAADSVLASRHCYVVMTARSANRLALPEEISCLLAAPIVYKPFELDAFLATVAEAARKLEGGVAGEPASSRSRPGRPTRRRRRVTGPNG